MLRAVGSWVAGLALAIVALGALALLGLWYVLLAGLVVLFLWVGFKFLGEMYVDAGIVDWFLGVVDWFLAHWEAFVSRLEYR